MDISVFTLFPKMYDSFLSTSLVKKGIEKNLVSIDLVNPYDFCEEKEKVDIPISGHGSGMLISAPAVEKVYEEIANRAGKKEIYSIFFSPHGKKLNQKKIQEIYEKCKDKKTILFAGRYEGFDVRAEEHYADEVISIGDYVLMGGDLPAMVFMESIFRLVPGVIGKESSVLNDSFQGSLLDCPHYSLPRKWKNEEIPEVLLSGNHAEIKKWREKKSIERTIINNFSWWRSSDKITNDEKKKVKSIMPNHYCLLLHNDVMMPDGRVGESSVTSIDIHDIARSSATYGIKNYYVVTRLESQKKLVDRFLNFWHTDKAKDCNENRAYALNNVSCLSEIDDVIKDIEEKEKKKPILIVTSSRREIKHKKMISYNDQEEIWKMNRPVLFIFGTAHGISPNLMEKIEYRLMPIEGIEEFNFLSVRSAVAVILDRWLGINYM